MCLLYAVDMLFDFSHGYWKRPEVLLNMMPDSSLKSHVQACSIYQKHSHLDLGDTSEPISGNLIPILEHCGNVNICNQAMFAY